MERGGGGEIKIQSTAFCLFTVTAAHQWRPNSTRRDFDLAVLLLIARFFLAADDILFLPTVASTRFSSFSSSSSFFFFYCYYHFEFLCHRLVFQIKKKKKKKKKKKDINSSRLASSFDIKMGFKCAAIAAGDLHQSRPFFFFVFVLILFLSSHLPILCTSPWWIPSLLLFPSKHYAWSEHTESEKYKYKMCLKPLERQNDRIDVHSIMTHGVPHRHLCCNW